jgi:hypothetical protein
MSYRNLHLTPQDQEFKEKYESVIDAHDKLRTYGEVEVTFTTSNGMLVWRRRCYEYQKITGETFRIEQLPGYALLLRPRRRMPIGDHGLISVKPARDHGELYTEESGPIPETGVVVTEADMKLAEKVVARTLLKMKEEGADDRGPDPGGDAADSGSSRGDD